MFCQNYVMSYQPSIILKNDNLYYTFGYDAETNTIDIQCEDISEFYSWKTKISNDFHFYDKDIKKSFHHLNVFDIFKDFKDKKLDDSIEIKFKDKYSIPRESLSIEIAVISQTNQSTEIKIIYLEPINIFEMERVNKKIFVITNNISNLINIIILNTSIIMFVNFLCVSIYTIAA